MINSLKVTFIDFEQNLVPRLNLRLENIVEFFELMTLCFFSSGGPQLQDEYGPQKSISEPTVSPRLSFQIAALEDCSI